MIQPTDIIGRTEAAATARLDARAGQRGHRPLLAVTVLVDVGAVAAGYALASAIRPTLLPQYRPLLFASLALWPAVFWMVGLYEPRRLLGGWQELRTMFNGISIGMFLVIMSFLFADQRDLSRGWTVAAWPSCLVTLTGSRMLLRRGVHVLRKRGRLRTRTLVVGTNQEARAMVRSLSRRPWLGFEPVGFACLGSDRSGGATAGDDIEGLPVLCSARGIVQAIRSVDARAVLIASSALTPEELADLYRDIQGENVDVRLSAGLLNIAASRMAVEALDGFAVLALRQMQLPRSQAILKRALDVAVGSVLVLLLAPVLLGIAVAIRVTSGSPVLFRQPRIGYRGEPFTIFKFRTMWQDADARRAELAARNEAGGPLFKLRDDPRVTPVGRFLRRWSLDELPQLLNVLRGEMSLVGPRPLPMEDVRDDPWAYVRAQVRPGITGLWQVNGRHELPVDEFLRYELFYVENWSIALDLSILWRTIPAVVSRRGSW